MTEDYTPETENYKDMSEIELMEHCRTGDSDAFGEVYTRYRKRLFSVAYRLHGNAGEAEDSLQDAFVAAFQNIRHFNGASSFSTWMYRILVNACMSQLRKPSSRFERMDMRSEMQHPRVQTDSDSALAALLEQEIARLPFLQRAVFVLHATDGHTHEEIADIMNIRPGTSKSTYHRARKALRDRLNRQGISSSGA